MATKKILTDEDFKELNHTLLEEWEKGNATSVTIRHDDGSIWYKGMYGGFGDRPFLSVVEYGLQKYDDAAKRFKEGLEICRRSMI
mgnify:CR=1 FL=1